MAATNPTKYYDALVYSGFTIPIPDDLKIDPNSDWLTKRYISNIRLKIKELENEIEKNLKDIDVTSKLCPPGTPGYGWVVELQSQNAKYNARIKTLKDEITPP